MRTLIFTMAACFISVVASAQFIVSFNVDMSEYEGPYTTVNLNGIFNEWCGECAPMEDLDGDGVFTLDVELAAGQIEYKFTLDGWTEQEMFNPGEPCTLTTGNFTNRVAQIEGDIVLDTVCWNSCGGCDAPPTSAAVDFKVDMNDYTGSFTAVNLNGTFNGWCGTCVPMLDEDGDGIYEVNITVPVGAIEYKFTLDGWEVQEELISGSACTVTTDEFTNRFLNVTEDVDLDPVCWNSCATCTDNIEGIDAEGIALEVFPNPAKNQLTIQIAANQKAAMLNLSNMHGALVLSQSLNASNSAIDISALEAGIYFVQVETANGQASQRLVVE